ncbi:hypothetical protein EH165_10675 [Nakamurella antarctica]|uniref:Uncharacterized protein n=1 Tax=Nakamurella antarctica TaxID=1902245 RepID=A0A3G8ZMP8_9ACTN|nr:hypothetical protein [Nakamurella antarctica]AZI58523.1 hypothetical protein EH165_10675 [Nakamurella antarctica]
MAENSAPPTPAAGFNADSVTLERQLYLVDRIIGLEAKLAEWTVRDEAKFQIMHANWDSDRENLHLARLEDARLRQEVARLESEVAAMRNTRVWRAGLRIQPATRIVKRALGRGSR